MTSSRDDQPGGGLLLGAGAGLLVVACCAGPALIAAGALTGFGAFLRDPWVIATGITLVALALLAGRRHRNTDSSGGRDCCPAPQAPARPDPTTDPRSQQNR